METSIINKDNARKSYSCKGTMPVTQISEMCLLVQIYLVIKIITVYIIIYTTALKDKVFLPYKIKYWCFVLRLKINYILKDNHHKLSFDILTLMFCKKYLLLWQFELELFAVIFLYLYLIKQCMFRIFYMNLESWISWSYL